MTNKSKNSIAAACIVTIFLALYIVANGGCGKPPKQTAPPPVPVVPAVPAVQIYQVGPGGNIIARTAAPMEIEADMYIADRPNPVRAKARIMPGTWLVPADMTIVDGKGVRCDDNVCEVTQ